VIAPTFEEMAAALSDCELKENTATPQVTKRAGTNALIARRKPLLIWDYRAIATYGGVGFAMLTGDPCERASPNANT
jgi:hypothetical protein